MHSMRLNVLGRHIRGNHVRKVGQMALSAHIGEVTAISPSEAGGKSSGGPLSTHVLDTAIGKPGPGVPVELYIKDAANEWRLISNGVTNEDGRLSGLIQDNEIPKATYKLKFDTETYFKKNNITNYFFPFVDVVFVVQDSSSHYHVPILLTPFGFTTYRGS